MKKFEYLAKWVPLGLVPQNFLNESGLAGWELVSVRRTSDGIELIFKRQI